MKRAVAGLLLALAACNQAPTADNRNAFPRVPGANLLAPDPNTATAMPPTQSTGNIGVAPAPESGSGPRERFIVCPGNPRCPPEGRQGN